MIRLTKKTAMSVLATIAATAKPKRQRAKKPSVPLTPETALPDSSFIVAVKTTNPLNVGTVGYSRGAAFLKRKERREQRQKAVKAARDWAKARGWQHVGRVLIELRRVGCGTMDRDGCNSALKWVRDGIAEGLGLDDDRESASLDWRYSQRVQRGVYGVEVVVTSE